MDYAKLTKDLNDAREAAEKAIEGVKDEGSCNLDYLAFRIGKNSLIRRRNATLVKAVEAAQCKLSDSTLKGRCALYLDIPTGQAYRNTLALETAQKVLSERGWPVDVLYFLD